MSFADWQPRYAALGIPTFPVREKRPAVRGYLKVGLEASRQFARKFPHEPAFGLACRPNRITVLDVDAPDERLLADALSEFGPTPFLVRSGSGNFQAWYRHNGERRRVRPDPSRPIDILGDGFVVAPPSKAARGSYTIISGGLDDLAQLPLMRHAVAHLQLRSIEPIVLMQPGTLAEAGVRNQTLWRECMKQVPKCATIADLMSTAIGQNQALFVDPLPEDEVERVVASAWSKQLSGDNWFGRGVHIIASAVEVDGLLKSDPDAFILLMVLRRHHIGRQAPFVLANAMAGSVTDRGWTRRRFADARRSLEGAGQIELVRHASKQNGPPLYRLKGGRI